MNSDTSIFLAIDKIIDEGILAPFEIDIRGVRQKLRSYIQGRGFSFSNDGIVSIVGDSDGGYIAKISWALEGFYLNPKDPLLPIVLEIIVMGSRYVLLEVNEEIELDEDIGEYI